MRALLLTLTTLALLVAGCAEGPADDDGMDEDPDDGMSGSPSPTDDGMSGPTTHDVDIENFAFSPASLTIQVGDTVRWTNMDGATHTSTADDGTWDSGNLATGESFEFTFDEAGTFDYLCTLHPSMQGEIVVEA